MQHSGAPTGLLDWTEAALIALYFAVRDKKDETDAAVWVLEPWLLNGCVLAIPEVIPPGAEAGLFKSDADRYKPWLPDRYTVSTELKVECRPRCTQLTLQRGLVLNDLASRFTAHAQTVSIAFLKKPARGWQRSPFPVPPFAK